jgi:hypothetical protein
MAILSKCLTKKIYDLNTYSIVNLTGSHRYEKTCFVNYDSSTGISIAIIGLHPSPNDNENNSAYNFIIQLIKNKYEHIYKITIFNMFSQIVSNIKKLKNTKIFNSDEDYNLIYLRQQLINYDIIISAYGQGFTKLNKNDNCISRYNHIKQLLINTNKSIYCFGLLTTHDNENNIYPILPVKRNLKRINYDDPLKQYIFNNTI